MTFAKSFFHRRRTSAIREGEYVLAKKAASGPLKNLATKGFSQMLQNAGANRATRKAIAGGFHRFLATGAGIESGISLATYGAAGGALQDAAQQSIEIKDGYKFGWSSYSEITNGRFAMIGFLAIVLIELFSKQSFLKWAGIF